MAHIFTVSAEPSGDALNTDLVRHLRALDADVELSAIGGPSLSEVGLHSLIDTSPLAVLGFTEGLKALPQVRALAMQTVQHIVRAEPDALVLIDSWGFSIRVAKLLQLSPWNGTVIKYVAPQVWAMRRGRAKMLARHVDHLLTLYPFDAPFFVAEGLPTTHVGNPVLDTDYASGSGSAFRARHSIHPLDPVLLVAFGSRRSEIERLADDFVATVELVKAKRPSISVVATTVPATRAQLQAKLHTLGPTAQRILLVNESEKLDAFAAADIALAKSGTVTTQLADAGVPTLVAYRVSGLTWWAARKLFKADHVSIVNVAAATELMPEFLQDAVVPTDMAAQLDTWLSHPVEAKRLGEALRAVTNGMRGRGGAGRRAAEAVLSVLSAR